MDTAYKAILDILEQTYGGSASQLRFASVFQLLIAVMLSAQTNDNQVNRVTERLFRDYPDARAFAGLTPEQLAPQIASLGLYQNKARHIVAASRILTEQYGGEVPADKQALTALPGVGNKTANVVLAVGFGIPALAVDTHVFRVSRRLGLSDGKNPEQVEAQLCAIIPREKWPEAHHWLIWHGRRVCLARKPDCDHCPLAALCPARPSRAAG